MKTFSDISGNFKQEAERGEGIHFGPLDYWVNDPAGLVFSNGWYHMFFQMNPEGTEWGNMHWGHAVSRDLLQWKMRPVAILPHPVLGMAFTGSIVVDGSNSSGLFPDCRHGFIAFLTTTKKKEESDGYIQTQSIAYSSDYGETWQWYEKNPVIPDGGLRDFRDPKVFYDDLSHRWCACISKGKLIAFYGSKNLLDWEALSEYQLPDVPDVAECPDLLRMQHGNGHAWVLFYSVAHDSQGAGAGVRYQIGQFDGSRFIPDKLGERIFDCGFDYYALQSWYGLPPTKKPLVIAWANNSAYSHAIPQTFQGVNGMMTIPREISLYEANNQLYIKQRPVTPSLSETGATPLLADEERPGYRRYSMERRFPFELSFTSLLNPRQRNSRIEIEISSDNGFTLSMLVNPVKESLEVKRIAPGLTEPQFSRINQFPASPTNPDLHLLIDKGIVELFVDDGRMAATYQLFNEKYPLELTITWPEANSNECINAYSLSQLPSIGKAENKKGGAMV